MLRPGGTYLVAVPGRPRLWSDHDEAVDHVRRYTRPGLVDLLERGRLPGRVGPVVERPAAPGRRPPTHASSSGSDLDDLHPVVNFGLRTIITAERYLPVKALPGVSLLLRARPLP